MERETYVLEYLHPAMQGPTLTLTRAMGALRFTDAQGQFVMQPFEGLRHPARQYHLLVKTKTTKAGPWQSAHQYGLAVDFAGRRVSDHGLIGSWFWPDSDHTCWQRLKFQARAVGLDVPIKWDYGHVEHPLFAERKISLKYAMVEEFRKRDDEWNWIA